MKNFQLLKLAGVLAALFVTHSALAASGVSQLTVNGVLAATTCTVASGDVNKTVTLPGVTIADMANASALSPVTFSFGLTNCDTNVSTAKVTLAGTSAVSDSPYTSVIASTGTATNVGIGFIGATSVSSAPAGPLALNVASAAAPLAVVSGATAKSGTVYLGALIVPLVKATAVTAGTVTGVATATFSYS